MTSGTFFSHTKPVRLATHDTAGLHVMTQRLNAIFADLEEVHTDNFDQALKTTDSPSFVGLDIDGAAQIASNLVLGGTLFNTQDNSSLIVSGGTAASQGGNVLLYGQSHASFANNIFLRAGAQNVYRWDEQNAQHVWYDQANATDLVLDCNARLRPSTDTELDLGSGSFRWGTVYASGATLTDLTVDTDTLHVDSTNDRVGIGTSSPSTELHVQSAGASTQLEVENTDARPAQVRIITSNDNNRRLNGLTASGNTASAINLGEDKITFLGTTSQILATLNANVLDVEAALVWTPSSSETPSNNGEVTVEATNNTTLTFKLKGSDGTVRSGTITLA